MKIIGIDPDIEKPGVCVLDESGAIVSLESVPICKLLHGLLSLEKDYTIAIEDLSKKKATYRKKGVANHKANTRVSNSIGLVQGSHRIIKGMAEYYGINVIDVPDGIGKQVKNNAALFNKLSGLNKRSNEDMRDTWAIAKRAKSKRGN